ncbi:Topoisomerase 1-associated factor 1, partial [Teratosphaeriaceae sp. CCFEE 6253]
MLQQMDQSKKWDKPKYRGGKKAAPSTNEQAEFGERAELDEQARTALRGFVADFLDAGFNPLFAGLRRAIEREADRVGDGHRRQYFYLTAWFLAAADARHASPAIPTGPPDQQQQEEQESPFPLISAALDEHALALLNRHMQTALDEKRWRDLHAALLAFTQTLLTIQRMAASADEGDREIAENIQQRVFYEEATQDRVVQALRGYVGQGFGYLDAATECAWVFVRMLEKFWKGSGGRLTVRGKRRRAGRRKRATAAGGAAGQDRPAPDVGHTADQSPPGSDDDDADADERPATAAASERALNLPRFRAHLHSQPCLAAFLALLHHYADLTAAQLKRCHRYLYTLAFKSDSNSLVLLFRADILLLFHRMLKGPAALSAEAEGYKDWETLVQQIFRR